MTKVRKIEIKEKKTLQITKIHFENIKMPKKMLEKS